MKCLCASSPDVALIDIQGGNAALGSRIPRQANAPFLAGQVCLIQQVSPTSRSPFQPPALAGD